LWDIGRALVLDGAAVVDFWVFGAFVGEWDIAMMNDEC